MMPDIGYQIRILFPLIRDHGLEQLSSSRDSRTKELQPRVMHRRISKRSREATDKSITQGPQPPAQRATPTKMGGETMSREERCWIDIELR